MLAGGSMDLPMVQLPLLWGVGGAVEFRNHFGTDNKLQ